MAKKDTGKINIASLNINRGIKSRNKIRLLLDQFKKEKLDIIMLQEINSHQKLKWN
jgi:exonuclease III